MFEQSLCVIIGKKFCTVFFHKLNHLWGQTTFSAIFKLYHSRKGHPTRSPFFIVNMLCDLSARAHTYSLDGTMHPATTLL